MSCPILPHATNHFPTVAQAKLGQQFELGDGTEWMYVQFVDAVAYVSGAALTFSVRATAKVTADESAGTDIPAGVIVASARTATQAVPAENSYGLIQTKGYHPAVNKLAGLDAISEGTGIIVHATTDGTANDASAQPPAVADLARWLGTCGAVSEDGTSGTWNEDTVAVNLDVGGGAGIA